VQKGQARCVALLCGFNRLYQAVVNPAQRVDLFRRLDGAKLEQQSAE
jgi:hypothetical protein